MEKLQEIRAIVAETEHDARRVLGSDFKDLYEPKSQHNADLRRHIKKVTDRSEKLLNTAKDEGRSLTEQEDKAFQFMMAVRDASDMQIYLNNLGIDTSANSKNGVVFAKDQKLFPENRVPRFDGVGIGSLMRAMVMGPGGNHGVQAALSEGTNSAGGYTVPTELLTEFFDLLRSKLVLNNAGARTVLLETAKTTMATVINDPLPGWRAENAAVSENDITFGHVTFSPKSLAVLVKVSRELLADSLNIEEVLMTTLAESIARQLDYAGLYGSGSSNQPLGLKSVLTTSSRVGAVSGNGAKLSASGNYLPITRAAQYVALSNDTPTAAIMSPRTLYDLGGLADGMGQPLQAPKILEGVAMLDSTVVPVNQTQGTATTASEIFVGNFSNLLLGLRQQVEIEIIRDAFAGNLQVGFLCHLRADWQVARPNSFWSVTGVLAE